tara:strand:- start:1004 stop:2362 length:1359 start_codon:yes stop_codon:yes gene_type:complete
MALINIFYSYYFNYLENIYSYLTTFFLPAFFGLAFFYLGKKEREIITIYEQLILIFIIYFFISFFISIPFYFSDYGFSFLNSYFESISGLTGTGFTVIEQIKYLDPPLILWRSSSQWIGGLYFLIFIILIFSNKQINFKMIDLTFNLEKKINFSSNLMSVTNRIFLIYLSLTALIFSLFLISGIRIFDSLNLAVTVISSGGFLPTENLSDIIRNNFQSIILSFSFLLSILNFYIFYNLILDRQSLKKHGEDFFLIILILIFAIIFYFMNDLSLSSVFINILSSIGNSGISSGAIPTNFALYFIILTLLGGSVLSLTSGLKFLRIYILIKAFVMEMYRLVKPNVVLNTKIMFSENKINTHYIKISFMIFILFFLSLFILSSILLVDILDFENSFKLSILTLTNTAASNIYGTSDIQFANLFTFSKISLIVFMVIAKVELLTVFILARKVFFKD